MHISFTIALLFYVCQAIYLIFFPSEFHRGKKLFPLFFLRIRHAVLFVGTVFFHFHFNVRIFSTWTQLQMFWRKVKRSPCAEVLLIRIHESATFLYNFCGNKMDPLPPCEETLFRRYGIPKYIHVCRWIFLFYQIYFEFEELIRMSKLKINSSKYFLCQKYLSTFPEHWNKFTRVR